MVRIGLYDFSPIHASLEANVLNSMALISVEVRIGLHCKSKACSANVEQYKIGVLKQCLSVSFSKLSVMLRFIKLSIFWRQMD